MSNPFQVTFWGVRGSYSPCGPAYQKVGGHTSCVSLKSKDSFLIFDAGTGLIDAGDALLQKGIKKATLFISHAHADHINGLAFFKPLHLPDFDLTIIAGGVKTGIESILARVISPPYFPVPWDQLASTRFCQDITTGSSLTFDHLKISTIALDHPGGSCGYRVDDGHQSFCYITDTAHTPGTVNQDLVDFIRNAHLFIYDAAFTEEEFAAKSTWGHSTWNQAVILAKAAGVQNLALFHHNPEHDDDFMDSLEVQARAQFPLAFVARQGMILKI
jgi:phosphoribosyl 1,2-cyclic phosphodiesterase